MIKKVVLPLIAFLLVLPIVYADMGPKPGFTITDSNVPYVLFFMIATMLTIMIEVLYAAKQVKSSARYNKILYTVIVANVISLPVIWFIVPALLPAAPYSGGDVLKQIFFGEILIVIIECLFIYALNKKDFTWKSVIHLTAVMNFLSFGYGAIVGFFAIGFGLFVSDFFFSLIIVTAFPAIGFLSMEKNAVWKVVAILIIALLIAECSLFLAFSKPYHYPRGDLARCRLAAATCASNVASGVYTDYSLCGTSCAAACTDNMDNDILTGETQDCDAVGTACNYCMQGNVSGIIRSTY